MKKIPEHIKYIVGIDEAGRGPLAGPVAVGVFCVSVDWRGFKKFARGVRDSKKLTEKKREEWFAKMEKAKAGNPLHFAVAFGDHLMIDKKGLSFTIRHALAEALSQIPCAPEETFVFLDGGLRAPKEFAFQETVIRGDDKIPVISLASIAAKVTRDRHMREMAEKYPEYGFERHKGYGTKGHYRAIEKHGIVEIHRRCFLKGLSAGENLHFFVK